MPKNVSPACHDINQDIARYLGISDREAFDMSREELVLKWYGELPEGQKHNALYDAKIIRLLDLKMSEEK